MLAVERRPLAQIAHWFVSTLGALFGDAQPAFCGCVSHLALVGPAAQVEWCLASWWNNPPHTHPFFRV